MDVPCRGDPVSDPDPVRSPPKPWKLGRREDYTAFKVQVTCCVDAQGRLWSEHDFDTVADEQVARNLPTGGVHQIAHALLVEAVRREAFTCFLVAQSKDTGFLNRWLGANDAQRAILEQELRTAAETVLVRTIPKLLPGAVHEVLEMMVDQLPGRERRS